MNSEELKSSDPIAWCPGCGDFGILNSVKKALSNLEVPRRNIVLVSGIGQAAKLPHYVNCNCFNGLHGRALPAAAGIKIANRELTVLVTTGDGDCYGEGGNHFLHNIRRNLDLTVVVHDNQIYGLTKGQASPTTELGHPTKIQPRGVVLEPFHPLEAAIALGCGFVARGFSTDSEHLSGLITEGIKYKGFALIDVLQPCPSFNKINTHQWYRERVYKLSDLPEYDFTDKQQAYQKAAEWGEKIPLGIIYKKEKTTYEERSGLAALPPLVNADISNIDIDALLKELS